MFIGTALNELPQDGNFLEREVVFGFHLPPGG